MKTKILLMVMLFFSISATYAQSGESDVQQVRDDLTREAFVTFHKRQLDNFKVMQENEGYIAATQELIKNEAQEIARIRGQIYNSLAQVNQIIMDIRSVVAIAQDVEYTYQYLHDCDSITLEHPELLLISMETKVALVNRMEQLGKYLVLSLTGGEMNLMNNKDRLVFISRVSSEMRMIKGYSNYLRFELQLAVKNGFWRSLFPGLFAWESRLEYNLGVYQNIISNFHLE